MDEKQEKSIVVRWRESSIFRVAAAYIFGAWILLQLGEIILPSYDTPNWVMQVLIATLILLFPVVLLIEYFTNFSRVFFGQGQETSVDSDDAEGILSLKAAAVMPITMVERRRISTLACSVRGVRSGLDDPELMVGVVAGMEAEVSEIIERYGGTRLPSGQNEIVVAFGYPRLHEDDARRAAKASLELNELVYAQDKDDDPTTFILGRIGVHTTTVVLDNAKGDADALTLLGDSKAVAEWLHALAPEHGVVACAETVEQIRSSFRFTELSAISHPRLGTDVPVYTLDGELGPQAQQLHKGGIELIGREHELGMLLDRWQAVLDGEGQYVLLKGEPGIGKSTLLHHAVRDMVGKDSPLLLMASCESYYQATPLYPIVNLFEKMVLGERHSPWEDQLIQLREFLTPLPIDADYALPVLAAMLSIELDDPDLRLKDSGQKLREKTLGLLIDLLKVLAENQPVLLVLEDIHWADPSTRDFIDRLLIDCKEDRILCLFTARPEITAWDGASNLITVDLQRLSARMSEVLLEESLGGMVITDKLREQIIRDGSGVPFYVEELVRGLKQQTGAGSGTEPITLPNSLQAVLAARLDQLGSSKPLLQLCSVLGHEFSYELLREVVRVEDDSLVTKVLGDLVAQGMLFQKGTIPDASFRFRHGLLMEAAYHSLITKTRSELHGTIGEVIESKFPELCSTAPVRLAQHFTNAGVGEKAISYRIASARHAIGQFATEEALTQIGRGLETLAQVKKPDERGFLELTLHNLKGSVLLSSRGYTNPEARESFERALELSSAVNHTPELFQMLVGLWMYYLIKGDNTQAEELGLRLLALAEEKGGAPELLQAYYCLGYSVYQTGELDTCLEYYEKAAGYELPGEDYTRQTPSHDDTRVHLHCMYAHALWVTGNAEKSIEQAEAAIQLAIDIDQPYAEVWARYQISWLYHERGDFEDMERVLSRAIEIATDKGFNFFIPLCLFFRHSRMESLRERIETMVQYHELTMQTGARSGSTYLKSLLVENLIALGEYRRAAMRLDEIGELITHQNEKLWQSEFVRLQTSLELAQGNIDKDLALSQLRDSVETSQKMKNLPFALRSALAFHDVAGGSSDAIGLIASVLEMYPHADTTAEYKKATTIASR